MILKGGPRGGRNFVGRIRLMPVWIKGGAYKEKTRCTVGDQKTESKVVKPGHTKRAKRGGVYMAMCSGKVTRFSGFSIDCLSVGPPGSLWARPLKAPWALMCQALMACPGLSWAGPLWAPLGSCGLDPCRPPGLLWAGPLVGSLGPCGLGPCGLPWALVGQALVGPLGPLWVGP